MTETLEQQSAALAKQQSDLAAQKLAYEAEQAKLAQIESQYMPKVGGVNIAYEHKYKAQLGQTQEQYKQLSGGIESYNVGVEAFKSKSEIAKSEIAKLNTTPTSLSDISFAKELYNKGYISKSDLDSYKDTAFKNIESQKQQKVVTEEITISDPVAYNKSLGATSADLAKIEMLQSPTAQWTSQESYNAALKSMTDKGYYIGKPGGTILTSTPEQRQAEKAFFEKTGFTLAPESFESDVFLSELQKLSPSEKESLSFAVSFPTEQYYPTFTPYVTEEGIQNLEKVKLEAKVEKWWSGLSETDKKIALVTAGTIDVRAVGSLAGERLFKTKESELSWKVDVYNVLKTDTKPYSIERLKEGIIKVGTGTTMQALATIAGMRIGMGIGAGTLKAVGMKEAGVVATEKGIGLLFAGVIAKELGTTAFIHGKPGTALAELGLLGITLPAAGIGTRVLSGVGKYTPKPSEFFKFVAGKAAPIKTTETFKFVEAKAEPITSILPEARVVRAFEGTRGLAEEGIVGAVGVADIPFRAMKEIKEAIPSPKRFVEFTAKKAEPIIASKPVEFIEAKTPDFIRSLREPVVAKIELQKMKVEPYTGEVLTFRTAETFPISESGLSPKGREKYSVEVKLAEKLAETPEIRKPIGLDFTKVKYISKAGKGIENVLLKETKSGKDITIAGSSAAEAQMGGLKPKDLDLHVSGGKKYQVELRDKLLVEMQKEYGNRAQSDPKHESRILLDGNHAIEIMPKEYIGSRITGIRSKIKEPTVIKGLKYQSLFGELLPKSIQSSLKVTPKKDLLVGLKDIRKTEGYSKELITRTAEEFVKIPEGVEVVTRPKGYRAIKDPMRRQLIIERAIKERKELGLETKEIERLIKKREELKYYATTPEAMALQYGYEFGKAYYEMQKGKPLIPLFLSTKPEEKIKKEKEEYYPKEKKEDHIGYYPILPTKEIFGGYYPYPMVKKETPVGYYPLFGKIEHPSGYYVPGKDDYYLPKPPVEKKKVPPILPPTKKEYPEEFLEPSKKMKDDERKGKPKEKIGYKYKYRPSPIFEGAEKLFEDKTDMVRLEAPRKPQIKRRLVKTTKPNKKEFDLGLESMENPLKTTNKKKKQIWEI